MQKMIVSFFLISTLLNSSVNAGAPKKKSEAVNAELKKLQGSWDMVKMEVDGRLTGNTSSYTILFDGDTYHFVVDGNRDPNSAKIYIDPTTSPMGIDLVLRGIGVAGTHLGIMRHTEDGLEICMNQPRGTGSNKRPSAFTTKAAVGAGSILFVLERRQEPIVGEKKNPPVGPDGKTPTKKDAIKADLQKLQGVWNMAKMEVEGRDSGNVDSKGVLFDGDNYSFVVNGQKYSNAAKVFIDPTREPKTIDFVQDQAGGVKLGIYRFTEDGLEICMSQANGPGSNKRPTVFTTKAKPGAGSVLYILELQKPIAKNDPMKKNAGAGETKSAKKDAIKTDLKKLQGVWDMAKMEVMGSDIGVVNNRGILFDGDTYHFVLNGMKKQGPAKIFLDPTTNPKQIDIVWGESGTNLGIYRFTDDGLEICMSQQRGQGSTRRPTAFTTKAAVGAGSILYVLEFQAK